VKHLTRASSLLVLLIAGFALVRCATSQVSIPTIGLVRDDNEANWASLPPRLGSPAQCARCHDSADMMWARSAHAGQTCEACHGAGDRHVTYGAILGATNELCTTCHEDTTGRPESFPTIQRLEHFPLEDCTACHDPHSPAAAFPEIPHNVQGREDCLGCHGVRDIASLPPNHLERPVELCLGCHKRQQEGPP
jgi:hypothetical protein